MDKDWIPVVGTLIGVLVGGGISSALKIIELHYQTKREEKKNLLSKLEELHQLVYQYTVLGNQYFLDINTLLLSEFNIEEFKKASTNLLNPLSVIHTKIMVYAPELENEWSKAVSSISGYQEKGFDRLTNKITAEEFRIQYPKLVQDIKELSVKLEVKISLITGTSQKPLP